MAGNDFAAAALKRWRLLGRELRADVAEFNSREGGGSFSESGPNRFRVSNSRSGLELTITADFEGRVIRYDYDQLSAKSAGAPEGGILSMRRTPEGAVELFSADQQLTSDETREILLQPVLSPPEMAA